VIAALALASAAAMQSAPHAPPGAAPTPLVGTDNAVTDAIAALRGEIEALGREPVSAARDARLALRRMAFDLLFHGTDDLDAQSGPVAGLRLAALRGEVDARLSAPLRAGLAQAAVDAPLARFAATATAIVPGPARDGPTPAVTDALGNLAGAIALMEGDTKRLDPWPAASALDAATGRAGGRAAGPSAQGAADEEEHPTDADAVRERIAAFNPQSLRPDARALAADLVRAAARAPGDAELDAIDADLRRLRELPTWVDAAAAAKASLRSRFDATTRAWVKSLHEPTRRAQARASMARFESERGAFVAFPMEAELRRSDPSAVGKAAGRAKDVLGVIDRLRAAWYEGWLDGRGDHARTAAAMRLVRALAAVHSAMPGGMPGGAADGARGADEAVAPAAWGGWPWIADAPAVPAKGLAARAELALAAVLDGDDAAADRQLATLDLELPLATLERTLRARLGPWSRGRSGLAHRLTAAVAAPGPDAWLGSRRADLCAVARLLAEAARARTRDDAPRMDALRREIARRAAPIASAP
jgi:hypothetical protein